MAKNISRMLFACVFLSFFAVAGVHAAAQVNVSITPQNIAPDVTAQRFYFNVSNIGSGNIGTIDITAPYGLTIMSSASNPVTCPINWTLNSANSTSVSCTKSGGGFNHGEWGILSFNVSIVPLCGSFGWGVNGNTGVSGASSAVGNLSFCNSSTPINITLLAPPNGSATNESPAFTWKTNYNSANCSLFIDGVLKGTSTGLLGSYSATPSAPLANGLHTWGVSCSYENLTSTSQNWSFTSTAGAPTLVLNSPPDGYSTGNPSPLFNWTATDSHPITCALIIDGSTDTSGISVSSGVPYSTAPASPLSDGGHTWKVSCNNSLGSASTTSERSLYIDSNAPSISVPTDITAEATGPSGAEVNFTATANDTVDGAITPVCTPPSGSTFPIGTTTVTCTATDAAGNNASASFNVIVQDTTLPEISVPSDITEEATSSSGAVVSFSATANDTVDGAITPVCVPASGSTFALGSTTVTCTATDAHNNSASDSFNVSVQDTTAPKLEVPEDITAEATNAGGATVNYDAPSATDAVGVASLTCTQDSGTLFPLGETEVSCTASDAAGNNETKSFTVTVQDTTAPSLTLPSGITEEATSAAGATVSYIASASDLVDGAITPTCAPASGETFAIGVTTVTCTATDSHNNTASDSFTVNVQDTTPPEISGMPSDITDEATSASGAIVDYDMPIATDIVDGSVTVFCYYAPGSMFPLGDTTVTCSATDAHLNTAEETFTVSVVDTTAPEITVPSVPATEATSPAGAAVFYTSPTATDLVDGTVDVSCDYSSGDTFPLGDTTVSCSATDSHSNTATASFTVTVVDTTKPVITLNGDSPMEVLFNTTYVEPGAEVTDNYDTGLSASIAGSVDTSTVGTYYITYDATDSNGNAADTVTREVKVVDTDKPIINVVGLNPFTIEVHGTYGELGATAYDAYDGDLTDNITIDSSAVDVDTVGSYTVTYDVTDSNGNAADQKTRDVNVVDTTKPVITIVGPDPLVIEVHGSYDEYGATASDNYDGDLTSSVTFDISDVDVDTIGTYYVAYDVTDSNGNAAETAIRTVSVVDTTAPEITLLGSDPVTIEVHSAYTDDGATASDNYDGDLTSSIVTYNPVNTELLGTYTLTYDVTDSNGNAADQVTRTVNVVDTTAPELGSMGDIIREADSASGAAVEFETPSATDNYDPSPSVDCVPASGSTFPIGTTTVTCTATDLSDNTASGSFNVMVVDTTAPVLAVPSDMTKEATSSAGAIAEFNSSANDTIDGPIDPICTPASGSTFPLGTTTVACSVTDSHNNTASGSFTVTVQDTTAPALTVPSDKSVSTKSKTGAKVTYVANATDIVDGPLAVICTPSSGSTFKVGATIVSCIATDSHNNTATATFKVKVSYKSSGSGGGGGGTPYVPPSPPSTIEPEAEPEPELPVQEPEPVIQSPGTKTPQTGTSGQNPLPTIPEPNADVPQAAALFGLDLGNLWLLCPIALLLGLILFAILTRKKCKSCKEKNWLWAKKCKKCGTAFGSK